MTNPEVRDLSKVPTISDNDELLRYGLCQVPIPSTLDAQKWAQELSQVTPLILAGEGDGEYAFYRNILEEPDFPFDSILSESSDIGQTILQHFPLQRLDELRLDDAFCVHYNMTQDDTSGAKHTDPSDITVNMCLQKTPDAQGSQVLFYGTKQLQLLEGCCSGSGTTDNHEDDAPSSTSKVTAPELFLVSQEPGYATIHFGDHPHETMPLTSGTRTNIVMTYIYKDPARSEASMRTCY
jgi:hypothetical protein